MYPPLVFLGFEVFIFLKVLSYTCANILIHTYLSRFSGLCFIFKNFILYMRKYFIPTCLSRFWGYYLFQKFNPIHVQIFLPLAFLLLKPFNAFNNFILYMSKYFIPLLFSRFLGLSFFSNKGGVPYLMI